MLSIGNALATGFTPFDQSDEIPANLTGRVGFRQDPSIQQALSGNAGGCDCLDDGSHQICIKLTLRTLENAATHKSFSRQ